MDNWKMDMDMYMDMDMKMKMNKVNNTQSTFLFTHSRFVPGGQSWVPCRDAQAWRDGFGVGAIGRNPEGSTNQLGKKEIQIQIYLFILG